jgi:hypothetical protein
MKKLFFALLITTISIGSQAQSKASLQAFWNKFQPLLVEQKFTPLSALVAFPLKSTGVEDGMTVLKITKPKFASAMSAFLKLDHIDTQENSTELTYTKFKDYYKNITKLNDDKVVSISGNWARIGDLEFAYKAGKWLLTNIYDGRTE